jgi:hypothetical protein
MMNGAESESLHIRREIEGKEAIEAARRWSQSFQGSLRKDINRTLF